MLQFHSDGLCFKILVVCELNRDMQTTKRVERFRHCGRPVSAEKLGVLAMKVRKLCLYTLAFTNQRWSIFCRVWSDHHDAEGNGELAIAH
jgi:hypothetical protein